MSKQYFGVMMDMSRNGVMKVEQVKKFVDYISAMGYNMLQLYLEDTYEVSGEPYFGYLRGGYTKKDLKEINAYCVEKGIELIPCIQTLAHLDQIFKWKEYKKINDVNDILLVGEDRTYELIENMFATVSECFTSEYVNIGMDEAHSIGLGKYLNKHGFRNRFDILFEHLQKVIEIAKRHNLHPMMWSDMFFRLANNGNYYGNEMPDEVVAKVPEGVDMVYWDYYKSKEEDYSRMLSLHEKMNCEIWFAGGITKWSGFIPFNKRSILQTQEAMKACKKHGVNKIMITLWGDNGSECPFFATLGALYAAKRAYDGVYDEAVIAKEFEKLFGESYRSFLDLDLPNRIGELDFDRRGYNPSKYHFYNDYLCGFYDISVTPETTGYYKKYAAILREDQKHSEFGYLFDYSAALCECLAVKADLGVKLRKAYKEGKNELKKLIPLLDEARARIEKFYLAFRNAWMTEFKSFGFDIQDARIGGLLQRTLSVKMIVEDYIDGKTDKIEELETELLDFYADSGDEEAARERLSEINNYLETFTCSKY